VTVQRWQETPSAVGRDVVDGWAVQLAEVAHLAEFIASTEFVPKAYRDQPAAVAAAILAGREMGIGPMTALQHLYVVEGRPAMSAQLMRALVMSAGHTLRVVESTSARCTVTGRRRGETTDREPVTWSGEEVRRAGLANRTTWQRYPRQMLLARATAELCRVVFPDVLGGMSYAVEEAADMPDDDTLDAAPAAPSRTVRRAPTAAPDAARPHLPGEAEAAAGPPPVNPPQGPGGPHPPPLPDGPGPPPSSGPDAPPGPTLPTEHGQGRPSAPPADPEPADGRTDDPGDGDAAPNGTTTASTAAPGDDAADDASDDASGRQRGHVFALLTELGVMAPRARRLTVVSALIGRNLESMAELTRGEAAPLIDTLARIKADPDPQATLDFLVAQGTARLVLGARDIDPPTTLFPDDTEATPP
jgi:hypothetical protein